MGKINQVLEKYIQLEEKYLSLLEDRNELKAQLNQKEIKLKELDNNLKLLKLSKGSGGMSDSDHTELKLKINEYIKEIDKCMAMLNV